MKKQNDNTETIKKRWPSSQELEKENQDFRNPPQRMKLSENYIEKKSQIENDCHHLTPELKLYIDNSVKKGVESVISKLNIETNKEKKELDAKRKNTMLEAVQYANEQKNNTMAALKFKVSETTIRRWRKTIDGQNEDSEKNSDINDEIRGIGSWLSGDPNS